MKKSFLSLPITFSVLVNVIPYQIFIQNTQITVFKKNSTKFGALPLLQECPSSNWIGGGCTAHPDPDCADSRSNFF